MRGIASDLRLVWRQLLKSPGFAITAVLVLAAIGAAIGLAGAVAAASFVRSFLFQVSAFDPVVLVLAAIGVFALALVASAMPARWAASVDPMQALRGE